MPRRPSSVRFPHAGAAAAALASALLALQVAGAPPDTWPTFRGPHARGVAPSASLPAEWDAETGANVRWKTGIPGLGHSSPVVWGERLFVTTAVAEGVEEPKLGDTGGIDLAADEVVHGWRVYALSADDGEILWQREVVSAEPRAKRHVKASQANSTPATDGETVVAILGSEGLFALDAGSGEVRWQVDLGELDPGLFGDPSSEWGHASSPVLWRDRVLVQVDRHADSFLGAYALADGRELWKVERDEMPVWATPTIHETDGRTELIVVGGRYTRAYDPRTGEELWRFGDEAEVKTPTPFVAGDRVILSGGYRGRPIHAVSTGGRGDLTPPSSEPAGEPDAPSAHTEPNLPATAGETTDDGVRDGLLWSTEAGGPYTSTPVAYEGLLFSVRDTGILSIYDLETGERLARERTEDTYSASLVAGDGKVYLTGENGSVTVLDAGREIEVLAVNEMPESCMGTPAIARDTLYFRCRHHVWAVGEEEPAGEADPPAASPVG